MRLDLLGAAVVMRDGSPPLDGWAAQRRSVALLAVLAAHRHRGISRDKLAALLWPDSDSEQTAHCLKQAIYVVRRGLGPDSVVGTHHLRLGSHDLSCDLWEFRDRLDAGDFAGAVAAYGGPFLDGFHLGGDSEQFEHWVEAQRDRLAQSYAEALEGFICGATERGDARGAIRGWRLLCDFDPLDRRYALGLVGALAAAGDPVAALRAAERYRKLVHVELGTPLDPVMDRLTESIRRDPFATG